MTAVGFSFYYLCSHKSVKLPIKCFELLKKNLLKHSGDIRWCMIKRVSQLCLQNVDYHCHQLKNMNCLPWFVVLIQTSFSVSLAFLFLLLHPLLSVQHLHARKGGNWYKGFIVMFKNIWLEELQNNKCRLINALNKIKNYGILIFAYFIYNNTQCTEKLLEKITS